MDRFLEKFNSKLKQEEIEIMNHSVTSTETEAMILKNLSKNVAFVAQDQMASQENSTKHSEKSSCLSF